MELSGGCSSDNFEMGAATGTIREEHLAQQMR
jgi:hypothetical protein